MKKNEFDKNTENTTESEENAKDYTTAREFNLKWRILSALFGMKVPVNVEYNKEERDGYTKGYDSDQESIGEVAEKSVIGRVAVVAVIVIFVLGLAAAAWTQWGRLASGVKTVSENSAMSEEEEAELKEAFTWRTADTSMVNLGDYSGIINSSDDDSVGDGLINGMYGNIVEYMKLCEFGDIPEEYKEAVKLIYWNEQYDDESIEELTKCWLTIYATAEKEGWTPSDDDLQRFISEDAVYYYTQEMQKEDSAAGFADMTTEEKEEAAEEWAAGLDSADIAELDREYRVGDAVLEYKLQEVLNGDSL